MNPFIELKAFFDREGWTKGVSHRMYIDSPIAYKTKYGVEPTVGYCLTGGISQLRNVYHVQVGEILEDTIALVFPGFSKILSVFNDTKYISKKEIDILLDQAAQIWDEQQQ